jgi:hypothetical protein
MIHRQATRSIGERVASATVGSLRDLVEHYARVANVAVAIRRAFNATLAATLKFDGPVTAFRRRMTVKFRRILPAVYTERLGRLVTAT